MRSARKGDFYWYADQHKHSDLLFADIHKIHYTHSGHMQCLQILQTLHYQHQEFTIKGRVEGSLFDATFLIEFCYFFMVSSLREKSEKLSVQI